MSTIAGLVPSVSPMEETTPEASTSCHPLMALPLELRLLIWEALAAEPRVFEYREDTYLIKPAREHRHARHVGLGICAESRKAVQALLRPFPYPLDIQKESRPSPSALEYVPSSDIVYLPPLVYRCRIGAWDSPWTTKPGIMNVGIHWSVLPDERRIVEALKVCSRCFTDMTRLVIFIEFKPLPQTEEEIGNGGFVRLLGPAEDDFRLPPLFSEAHGLMDEFWTWGELRIAIEKVRKEVKGMPEVEGVLYCREVEEVFVC
ncbi:uncharacterized protein ColSpa_00585 [Colletotrichum spaethianum]|uniref:2EXR domain-containing protein n=1 Tax=Colletotrichum spaethianum TaxID=700344 RepID=A0AA37L4H8_9PEZI|nr:uncharacterized protein ColSpa_00585 [Colletotrichum spaethianum]GKT40404.1 hypothetical protein ColSpa_00585 [Colletotrichum spaethianum]